MKQHFNIDLTCLAKWLSLQERELVDNSNPEMVVCFLFCANALGM